MRERKYRAWNPSLRKFEFSFDISSEGIVGKHNMFETYEEKTEWVLEDFTGFYDKNGVEIYEGDIMYFKSDDPLEELGYYEIFVPIVFQNGAFGWIGETTKSFISFDNQDLSDHEIIGNIHLNSELIK